jgi:transcription termination factor Rho
VLVVCASERTEAAYFTGLRDSIDNRAVDVRIVRRPKAPVQVVQYAVEYAKRATADFDEIWCVFDVDEFDITELAHANNPSTSVWRLVERMMER